MHATTSLISGSASEPEDSPYHTMEDGDPCI